MSFKFDKQNNIIATDEHVYKNFKDQMIYNKDVFERSMSGENYVTYKFGETKKAETGANFTNLFKVGITFDDKEKSFNFWIEVRADVPFISDTFKQLDYEEVLEVLYDLGLSDKSEQIWSGRNYFIDHVDHGLEETIYTKTKMIE